jgi:hypothetical protein
MSSLTESALTVFDYTSKIFFITFIITVLFLRGLFSGKSNFDTSPPSTLQNLKWNIKNKITNYAAQVARM